MTCPFIALSSSATARACSKIQLFIERENLEVVTMRSRRRLRAAVTNFSKIIFPFNCALRRAAFRDGSRLRIEVPNQPMREQSAWRVGIIDDEHETFCVGRRALDPSTADYCFRLRD